MLISLLSGNIFNVDFIVITSFLMDSSDSSGKYLPDFKNDSFPAGIFIHSIDFAPEYASSSELFITLIIASVISGPMPSPSI